MPRISARVVCTLCETMVTLEPTSALSNVDLPALGAPIRAMKPQRVSEPCAGTSAIKLVRRHAHPRKHLSGGRLLGGTFGAAQPLRRRPIRQYNGNAEFRIVVRSGARQFPVGRSWKSARLRPFLQHRFRIAQWTQRFEHALFPKPHD